MKIKCRKQGVMSSMVVTTLLLAPSSGWSHGFAGKRFFPTTLATEDPFVSDELSFLVNHIKEPGSGDEPSTLASEFEGEWTKRITPYFGITVGGSFRHLDRKGEKTIDGFGNLEVGAKYQFFTSAEHEALMSIGVFSEVGDTGDRKAEADPFSTISPTFFFGKGFGDLPDSWKLWKPFAITGVFAADFPTDSKTVTPKIDEETQEVEEEVKRNPTKLRWGFSLQYNLQYLQSFVQDVGLKEPFNRMIPLVEVAMESPINRGHEGEVKGIVAPGIVWFGKYVQLGLAAQVPVNDRTGDNIGFLAQFHVFIDDVFPNSLGKPIFGSAPARPAWWRPATQ